MGIRQLDTTTQAEAARWAGAPEPAATRSAGPRTQARTLPPAGGGRLAGAALLRLQRTNGNRYVQRLLGGARQATGPLAEAELVVGPADDDQEREADRLAAQVTRLPAVRPPQREETSAVRASGRSLPAPTRAAFETAFGADFGAVRVHTGGPASRLSRGLRAQAFTHGADVYFGAGRYAPGTPAGRRLLAHELAHVVQQGGAPPRRDRAPGAGVTPAVRGGGDRIQRKLSWQHTDWTEAERAWQSAGGGLGVVFVTDERDAPPPTYEPVVVKTGEDAPAEVVLAANLHGVGQVGVWRLGAPGVRTVSPDEGRQIKQEVGSRILTRPGWQKVPRAAKAKQNIDNADQPGTMVFEYVGGTEFSDLLTKETAHTEAKRLGGRRLRKDSPARLFKDRDFVVSLGRFTAIDIFTGNYDRLMRYNPTNFKVDRAGRTILLIDNVQMSEEFAFKSFQNSVATLTSDKAYRTWSQRHDTRWLRAGDLKAIAGYMVQSLKSGIENWEQVRPEDLATVQRALDNSRGWWVQGLEQGREWLRAAAQSLDQLTQGIAPEDVREVQESLMKRLNHLFPELFPELRRRALAED